MPACTCEWTDMWSMTSCELTHSTMACGTVPYFREIVEILWRYRAICLYEWIVIGTYLREVELAVAGHEDVALHICTNELRLVFEPLVANSWNGKVITAYAHSNQIKRVRCYSKSIPWILRLKKHGWTWCEGRWGGTHMSFTHSPPPSSPVPSSLTYISFTWRSI